MATEDEGDIQEFIRLAVGTAEFLPGTFDSMTMTASPLSLLTPPLPHGPDASFFADYFQDRRSVSDDGALADPVLPLTPVSISPRSVHEDQPQFPAQQDDANLDEDLPAKRKRTRRIFGTVQGNNKVGQKGKIICTNCRKIHSKCEFTSEDEPCHRCAKKNLVCDKVWGPKKARSAGSDASGSSGYSSPATISGDNLRVVGSPVSLIMDTDLSHRELYLLRRLFRRHQSNRITSCVGFLLQNLWNTYGSVFVDKSLLYAALTFESYWDNYSEANRAAKVWSPTGSWEYYSLKSRFHESLITAIGENRISECHFFALFMASQSSLSGEASFKEDLNMYQRGMVQVQKYLKEKEDQKENTSVQHLKPLHPFIFSFTRRILCRGDFSMPEYLAADMATQGSLDKGMHKVRKKLPHVVGVLRDIPSNPIQESLDPNVHNVPYHNWDYWNEVDCCLCREFDIIGSCFQLSLRPVSEWDFEPDQVADVILRTRHKMDGKLNWHDAAYVFRAMHDAFEPKMVREGHPHVRGLINFLISLFRASALLTVLEFLLLSEADIHRRRLFVEFRRAEIDVAKYDPTVWSLRKTELLVAMALLLAPQLFPEDEHVGSFLAYMSDLDMLEHRSWLSEVWFNHYNDEKTRFSRCQDCPCRSLTRVQRLWSSGMTREDYRRFLSENTWVWATEPGWAMEERLISEPDSFERIYTPCPTCCDATFEEGIGIC